MDGDATQPTAGPEGTPPAPAAGQAIPPSVVANEVREAARAQEGRRRTVPRAALVGVAAGLVAVLFRWALEVAEALRGAMLGWAHRHPPGGVLLPVLWGAVGAGAGVYLVQRFAPEAAGSGIPHLKAVLHRLKPLSWARLLAVKFAGGVLAIGGGLALGREGPTVQMGGAVGQLVSRWRAGSARERQTLIAAGAGAGLAAAFNTPLSGVVFVLEELQRDFSPSVFTAAFVACAIADVVTRLLCGQMPDFHTAPHPIAPLASLPTFAALGVLAGLLGVAFNGALVGSLRLFGRAGRWPRGLAAALAGAGVGLIGWFVPGALGGGHVLAERTLAGEPGLAALAGMFALRFALTMASYGTGAAGGIFAPLLVLGAQLGLMTGIVAGSAWPAVAPEPTMFAVVGMAAAFAAIVRAPLTGIVLIVEMTSSYALMLPLLVTCLCAYAVTELLGDRPIYEALLERDLLRSQDAPGPERTRLVEVTIAPGSPYDGLALEELGLPRGCLPLSVKRGGHSLLPAPELVLQPGDRLTAAVAAEAEPAARRLRAGAGGS